ncbi:MAG: malonic semialdehyde reductase [Candidatus Obscuribacterales bacterium]|nr:malonic semialdehyde reductase [Candidatus Obscuribacterales bacterium]
MAEKTAVLKKRLSEDALNQLFLEARTFSFWIDKPISEETIHELYNLLKMGPTSANGCPARFLFLTSKESKERLAPALVSKNVEKTMKAPLTVIVAWDNEFYEEFPKLTPHFDWKPYFAGKPDLIQSTVFRNSSLQGAYLILAARALGLDCGPMSGFDNAKVDAEFFAGTKWQSNFICNIGYGDPASLHPRNPRLSFDDACKIL